VLDDRVLEVPADAQESTAPDGYEWVSVEVPADLRESFPTALYFLRPVDDDGAAFGGAGAGHHRGDGHHRGTPEERDRLKARKEAEQRQEAEQKAKETTAPEVSEYLRGLTPWAEIVGSATPKVEDDGDPSEEKQGEYRHVTKQNKIRTSLPHRPLISKENRDVIWPGALLQGARLQKGEFVDCGVDALRTDLSVAVEVAGASAAPFPIAPGKTASYDAFTQALWPQGKPEQETGEGAPEADDEEEGGEGEKEGGEAKKEHKNKDEGEKQGEGEEENEEHLPPGERRAPNLLTDFTYRECDSSQAMLLDVGISAKYMLISAESEASLEQHAEETTIHAVLWHEAFQYVCDGITPETVFKPDVTMDDLKRHTSALGPGNPPVYVSAVTYGRFMTFAFHSKANSSLAKAALQFGFEGGAASGSGHLSSTLEKVLKDSKCTVLAVGGREENVEQMLKDKALSSYFSKPVKVRDCVPITFSLRSLADGGPARIPETLKYAETTVTEDFAVELSDRSYRVLYLFGLVAGTVQRIEGNQVLTFAPDTDPTKMYFEVPIWAADPLNPSERRKVFLSPEDFRDRDKMTGRITKGGLDFDVEFKYTATKRSPHYI
jgi:hypothetical protein